MEYKLAELFDLQMGKTPSRNNPLYWDSKDHAWISIADLSETDGKYVKRTKEFLSDKAIAESGIKEIPKNTVIMSFKLSIGKVAITPEVMYSNEAIMAFIDKGIEKIIPDYLYYLFLHKNWNIGTNKAVMGITLNKKVLSDITIRLHSVKEQKSIISVLDKVYELIEKRKSQLQLLDNLIKARFVEMFGDPETNPKGWKQVTLGDVCSSIVRGPFGSALKKEFFVEPNDTTYKVYEQKHAIQKSATIGTYYVTEDKYRELKRFECVAGDILMSCSGTMGELYQLPDGCERGIINQALCKFTLNDKILPICFLIYMKQTIRNLETKGSGIKNIAAVSYVKEMPINLPPMSIQEDFASFVAQVDKSKIVVQKSLQQTQLLFDSLMQQYFG